MEALWLFAVGIDAVRDIFRADDPLAAHLRGVAATRFPSRAVPAPGMLSRLGPLFRRQRATEVDPSQPLAGDVDAMLAGGFIAPDRSGACWRLLLAWLEDVGRAAHRLEFDDIDDLEFDLARAGLPSQYSLRSLAGRPLGIPLQPLRGQVVGYCKHVQAVETLHALHRLTETTSSEFASVLTRTIGIQEALRAVVIDPALDLVVIEEPA